MKRKIMTGLLLVMTLVAQAQEADAAKELQKIRAYYAGPELKHVAGQMLLVDTDKNKQVDKVTFEYWLKGSEIFTKMNYIEILSNSAVYVMVNHKRKSIYARPIGQVTPKTETPFFDAEQLRQLLNVKGTSAKLVQTGGQNKLTITGLADSRFRMVTINYDAANGRIISLDAAIRSSLPEEQALLLKVTYSVTEKTAAKSEPQVFASSKYLENTTGEFRFTRPYQNYQKL